MSFIIPQFHKGKSNTYTLLIIPNKYGKSKSLNFNKSILIFVMLLLFIMIMILYNFFTNYSSLNKENVKNLQYLDELKQENLSQQLKIKVYDEKQDEFLEKLQEIQELHNQLKSRLGNTAILNTKVSNKPEQTAAFADISSMINNAYETITTYDKAVATEKHIPNIFPYYGKISSYYGIRSNPVSRGYKEKHHGIDITGPYKSKIIAAGDGIVEYSGWLRSYGNTIIINHQNGYKSLYAHNSKLLVRESQYVKRGQTISLMGNSGRSTGTHVHFEVRLNGVSINPLKIQRR